MLAGITNRINRSSASSTLTTNGNVEKEENNAITSPIRWAAIIRDDTLLLSGAVETSTSAADQEAVTDAARNLLNKDHSPGWDSYNALSLRRTFRGLKFHEYQEEENSDGMRKLLVWTFVIVYDARCLSRRRAQAFIEQKIVFMSEMFRRTDKSWTLGGHLACQDVFGPILQQRVDEMANTEMSLADDDLSLSNEIIARNKALLTRRRQEMEKTNIVQEIDQESSTEIDDGDSEESPGSGKSESKETDPLVLGGLDNAANKAPGQLMRGWNQNDSQGKFPPVELSACQHITEKGNDNGNDDTDNAVPQPTPGADTFSPEATTSSNVDDKEQQKTEEEKQPIDSGSNTGGENTNHDHHVYLTDTSNNNGTSSRDQLVGTLVEIATPVELEAKESEQDTVPAQQPTVHHHYIAETLPTTGTAHTSTSTDTNDSHVVDPDGGLEKKLSLAEGCLEGEGESHGENKPDAYDDEHSLPERVAQTNSDLKEEEENDEAIVPDEIKIVMGAAAVALFAHWWLH